MPLKDEKLMQAALPDIERPCRLQVEANQNHRSPRNLNAFGDTWLLRMGSGLACLALIGFSGWAILPLAFHAKVPTAFADALHHAAFNSASPASTPTSHLSQPAGTARRKGESRLRMGPIPSGSQTLSIPTEGSVAIPVIVKSALVKKWGNEDGDSRQQAHGGGNGIMTRIGSRLGPATKPLDDDARRHRIDLLERSRAAIDTELDALKFGDKYAELPFAAGAILKKRPEDQMKALYAAFNDRDTEAITNLLAEDVVYEDLLLGASTICRGREDFSQAVQFHPAYVSQQLGMGKLEMVVDEVACDGTRSVGVEWHVEIDGKPFPLSRGLSLATLNEAGELHRIVDIAEAPWRVLGLWIWPLLSSDLVTKANTKHKNFEWLEWLLAPRRPQHQQQSLWS